MYMANNSLFTMYLHILSQLVRDVKKFGPLDLFYCFSFENYLGQLKRLLKSPTNLLQQVYRKIYELQSQSQKNTLDYPLIRVSKHSLSSIHNT